MAESATAIILAAIALASGYSLFTRSYQKSENSCNCTTISSVIFLTAVFAWVSAKSLNIFRCKLPAKANFFFEFFASMFIFEMALRLFWEPLECFISSTLPSMVEEFLEIDDCCFFNIYCPGDTLLYTVFVYVLAFWFVWSVLYGYGVISEKL